MPDVVQMPQGYDFSLDRPISNGGGCSSIILFGAIWIVFGMCAIFFVLPALASGTHKGDPPEVTRLETSTPTATFTPTETSTPTIMPTLDDWSRTGTALFLQTQPPTPTPTPTVNYCWFLTPTFTPTFTPNAPTPTPDDWARAGTATVIAAWELNPPTATLPPPQMPPRAWCDITPNAPPPTETPEVEITEEPAPVTPIGGFPTMVMIDAPATWTPIPPPVVSSGGSGSSGAPPAPVVITQIVIRDIPAPTDPPIDFDATLRAVNTQIALTYAPTFTTTFTPTPSSTYTPTESATPTETLTPTLTETATATYTETATETATASQPPTETITPTYTVTPSATPTATLPPPFALFTWLAIEPAGTIQFINESVNAVQFAWDFQSDGLIDERLPSPIFWFAPGTYQVTLHALGLDGLTIDLFILEIVIP